ncbi:hypothetical protein JCM17823_14590 [Halorubrum gandharaense]
MLRKVAHTLTSRIARSLNHISRSLGISERAAGLWLAVVALAALDAASTTAAVSLGLPELNPLVDAAMGVAGLPGLVATQLALVVGVTALAKAMDGGEALALGVSGVIGVAVVANNTLGVAEIVAHGVTGGFVVAPVGVALGVLAGVGVGYVGLFERDAVVEGVRGVETPAREEVFSVAFSVLMVTSMIASGVALVGTQPMGEDQGGAVSADTDAEYHLDEETVDSLSLNTDTATQSGGTVYVGSDDDTVYAIDAATGEEEWAFTETSGTVRSSPTVADGTVYVGSDDDTVYAIDAATGEEEWAFTEPSDSVRSSPTVADGTVYVGSYDDTLYAIDAATGEEEWAFTEPSDRVVSSPTVADGTVYVGSLDGTVYAIDEATGEEEWAFTEPSDNVRSSPTVVDGTVYVGSHDDTVYAIDEATGEEEWAFTEPSSTVRSAPTVTDGTVYVGSLDGTVYAIDAATGEEEWAFTEPSDNVRSAPTVADGTVYAGSDDDTVYAIDEATGEEEWAFTEPSGSVRSSPTVADGTVYVGSYDDTVYAIDAATGEEEWAFTEPSDSVVSSPTFVPDDSSQSEGSRVALQTLGHHDGTGQGGVGGGDGTTPRVTDQNGDPIEDATVEAYRADGDEIADQLELSAEEAEQEAEALLDEASDPIPDAFDEDLNPLDELRDMDDLDGEVALVHQADDWEMEGRLGAGVPGIDTAPNLDNPDPVHEAGEPLVVSMWDMDGGSWTEDDIDASVDGATSVPEEREIVIEQVAAEDTIDTRTIETSEFVEITALTNLGSKTHYAATTEVPEGFYRIYPEGQPEKATYHSVGDPSQAASLIEQELRDDADQLTDRAQNVQDRIESGIFDTQRATTNESGVAEDLDLPDGQVAIQAYKGPDVDLIDDIDDPTDLTIDDIREVGDAYDGAIYLPSAPERVDTRDLQGGEDVEVTLQKVDTDPFTGMEEYEDRIQDRLDELLNESTSELEQMFRDTDVPIDELEERHENLEDIMESNADLEERVEDLLESDDIHDAGNATEAQLEEDLDAMQQALAEIEEGMDSGTPNFDIDNDGLLTGEMPFGSPLDEEATSVVLHFEDGTSEVVSEDYWTVESGGLLESGDAVALDGYDIPEDRAVADVSVNAVSEGGALGSGSGTATNPQYEGDIPDIDAIDVGTLRPGVGETVGVQVRSDDDAFATTEDVQVFGPDGDELDISQEGDRFRWSADAEGTHTVRTTYSNDIGGEFTETFRLSARDSTSSNPPTVRITDGIGGDKALAGDGLESASIDIDGDTAEVIAQTPGGESPSQIDIRAEQLRVDELDVSVVSGENQRSVDRHVSVRVRAQFGEDSLVWHPDAPITADGDTVAGEWETREDDDGARHQVIDTYTDADGTTNIEVNRDPGWIDRAQHSIAVSSPFDIPFVTSTLLIDMYSPLLDEATPGEVVGPADMTAAPAGAAA